jgi:hypothetical protein
MCQQANQAYTLMVGEGTSGGGVLSLAICATVARFSGHEFPSQRDDGSDAIDLSKVKQVVASVEAYEIFDALLAAF